MQRIPLVLHTQMMPDKKLTTADVFKDELLVRGEWVVACVDPKICWPMALEKIAYRKQQLYVIPQFDDYYPSVAVMRGPGLPTFEAAQVLLLNFLSAKCWLEGHGCDVAHWTGGNLPRPVAGFARSGVQLMRTMHYNPFEIPDVADQKARWSLAFYREGLSIQQVPYAFLSFYKIINILRRSGKDQKAWINGKIDAAVALERIRAKPRLDALRKTGADIGEYLYESGRCAIAHAGHGVTVDPEDPRDLRRLADDLPLMKALAAYGIEHEFGINSARTIYDMHLYELRGFREHFGAALTARLKSGESPVLSEYPALPNLTIGLHRQDPFAPLTDMAATIVASDEGYVLVECTHASGRTGMFLWLAFHEERLGCDVFYGLESIDDGSAAAAAEAAAVMCFRRNYFANGQLIVRHAATGEIWGRCDAFKPVNVDMGRTLDGMDATIAKFEAEAVARAAARPR